MWERIEARIRENESEAGDVAPLRRPLLAAIRDAGLTLGEGATVGKVATPTGCKVAILTLRSGISEDFQRSMPCHCVFAVLRHLAPPPDFDCCAHRRPASLQK